MQQDQGGQREADQEQEAGNQGDVDSCRAANISSVRLPEAGDTGLLVAVVAVVVERVRQPPFASLLLISLLVLVDLAILLQHASATPASASAAAAATIILRTVQQLSDLSAVLGCIRARNAIIRSSSTAATAAVVDSSISNVRVLQQQPTPAVQSRVQQQQQQQLFHATTSSISISSSIFGRLSAILFVVKRLCESSAQTAAFSLIHHIAYSIVVFVVASRHQHSISISIKRKNQLKRIRDLI